MSSMNSLTSMIRGADGRLYAVTAAGVTAVAETAAATRAALRAGDHVNYDDTDHKAGRTIVTPGF